MKNDTLYECDSCHKEFKRKKLKRVNKVWRCRNCYNDKLSKRQESLKRNVLKISKEQEAEEDKKILEDNKSIRKIKVKEYQSRPEVRERINKYRREYYGKKNLERGKEREQFPPKIKGSNIERLRNDMIKRQSRRGSWYVFGYLTKVEKLVLYKKYVSQGMNPETANIKIKRDVKYLSEFVEKLRNKKKSDEKIGKMFKEEFAKITMND